MYYDESNPPEQWSIEALANEQTALLEELGQYLNRFRDIAYLHWPYVIARRKLSRIALYKASKREDKHV